MKEAAELKGAISTKENRGSQSDHDIIYELLNLCIPQAEVAGLTGKSVCEVRGVWEMRWDASNPGRPLAAPFELAFQRYVVLTKLREHPTSLDVALVQHLYRWLGIDRLQAHIASLNSIAYLLTKFTTSHRNYEPYLRIVEAAYRSRVELYKAIDLWDQYLSDVASLGEPCPDRFSDVEAVLTNRIASAIREFIPVPVTQSLAKKIRKIIDHELPREQHGEVITALYGVNREIESVAQLAKLLGITKGRIRQIRDVALRKIRTVKYGVWELLFPQQL